jgi:hypothetical protein
LSYHDSINIEIVNSYTARLEGSSSMENLNDKRTTIFRWNTRYELYDYFRKNFGLVKKDVDREIHAVMATFKPRKGRVIKTVELWQKVGLNLEDKNTPSIEVGYMEG